MKPTPTKTLNGRRNPLLGRLLACALAILGVIAALSLTTSAALPRQDRTGLDGPSDLTMLPVNVPAKVSRVAVVPGTGGREAWAIGQMTTASDEWEKERDQVVFLHYNAGRWRLYGPPQDASGNIVKDIGLGGLDFVSSEEGWAVGSSGALVRFSGGRWTYINACAEGQPMQGACGDLFRVSLAKQGSTTVGFAVGAARSVAGTGARLPTVLKLDPGSGSWSIDDAVAPADDFASVTTITGQSAWAVASSTSQELRVYRRNLSTWERVPTGKRMFDFPAPSQDGRNVNLAALGQAIDATPDGNTVWIGGGIYPVNPGAPLEPSHMPFMLRWRGGTFTAFCPRQYALQDDRVALSDVCDEGKTLPISPLDISSMSIVGDGDDHEVFAGGYGLFHFKGGVNGRWSRTHDAVSYLSSVSFASSREGWVANSGRAVGGSGIGVSDSTLMGHYSASSGRSKKAELWPAYVGPPLLSVDVSSSGRALAVGESGASMMYTPGVGWDVAGQASNRHLRAVQWASRSVAYAVGDLGAIARFDDRGWTPIDSPGPGRHLYGIAFSSPSSGYAVGDRGTIMRFDGGRWASDPKSGAFNVRLHDVASVGGGFVAVGEGSTILLNPTGAPGDWSLDSGAASLFDGVNHAKFYAVEGLGDGTIVAAGNGGLIGRDPGGSFRRIAPFDSSGSFLDIDLRRSGSALQILASWSPDKERFQTRRSAIMYFDGADWEDLSRSSYRSTLPSADLAGHADPAFGVTFDESGAAGWAVGGTLAKANGDYDYYLEDQTNSIFRIDLAGDAKSRGTDSTDSFSSPPKSGFRFAYFSDSTCGAGPCSLIVGSGTRSDRVAVRIRDEINRAAQKPNGPKFVIFGGNMRHRGMPEEVEQFEQFLRGFDIPVYAAMGPHDLLTTDTTQIAERFLPDPPDQLGNAVSPPQDLSAATNSFYLNAFRNMPAPWGTDDLPPGFTRVPDPPGTAAQRSGFARTFYAVDYAPAGRALARFVVLDTSDRFFAKPNTSTQNPPSNQAAWLPEIMSSATTRNPPIPVIVVANVPTQNPLQTTDQPVLSDAPAFSAAVTSGRASAVFSGFVRGNYVNSLSSSGLVPVPNFILGSGGAPPLTKEDPKRVNDGQFYAWHIVDVDTSTATDILRPQARVSVKAQPVLEYASMHAVNGLVAPAGNTLQFEASGRTIIGGGPPGDTQQNRNAYMKFPSPDVCLREGLSGDASFCRFRQALAPEYHFVSEDPSIARFVRGSNVPRVPFVQNGALFADDQSGLLCALKPGRTFVRIVAGGKQMRMPVTVTGGFGPCIDKPIFEQGSELIVTPRIAEQPGTLAADPLRQGIFRPPLTFPDSLVVVLPPVPAPIAAPAPPASAAGSRKEEEEAEFEQQGDEGESQHQFRAMTRDEDRDYLYVWMVAFAATIAGSMVGMALTYRRRYEMPSYVKRRN